jgi:hypothetical protein
MLNFVPSLIFRGSYLASDRSIMTTNQQQVGALLKAVIGRGVETKDAIPTITKLIEAKIFDLRDLTTDNVPSSIDPGIRNKLLPRAKRGGSSEKGRYPAKRSKGNGAAIVQPPVTDSPISILINRSPVLTLWATIVARNLYTKLDLSEALSLGSAVAAQIAKAKGTELGIFSEGARKDSQEQSNESCEEFFDLLGVKICAAKTDVGIRATINGQIQDPSKTWARLKRSFQGGLGFVMAKMDEAAKSAGSPEELEASAYRFYMHIRPHIPEGTKGWGAHGHLETTKLSSFYASKFSPQQG